MDDDDESYNLREATSIPYEVANIMEYLNWAVALKLIISDVTSKTKDVTLTDSGANILTSDPHRRRCSDYYAGINNVLNIIDSVNPNTVSLHSTDFECLINSYGPVENRYIYIVSNMLE